MDTSSLIDKLVGVSVQRPTQWSAPTEGAIAWARVSTDRQEERGLSIPEQLREIRSYAEGQGIEIVHEFQEAASAFQDEGKRVEFHRMLATAKTDPRVSLILVHDFSRFSRDSLRAKVLVTELRAAGVRLVSLNDPVADTDTAVGVYMEAITFAKNEAYSREIGFHVRKGCRANVQTRDPETGWCYKNGGEPPWGYRAVNVERGKRRNRPIIKRLWELDDTVISGRPVHEWVRHCLIELAAKGATLRELSIFCQKHQLPRRRGGPWTSHVWHELLGPTALLQYCGYGTWGARRTGQSRLRSVSEWVVVSGAHAAIITSAEAHAIAVVTQSHRERSLYAACFADRSAPYLLSGGVLKCGACGRSMIGYDTRHYACPGRLHGLRENPCRVPLLVLREPLDEQVVSGLRHVCRTLGHSGGPRALINRELAASWRASREADQAEAASQQPPRLHRDAIDDYRRYTESALLEGSPGKRKRVAWTWLESALFEPNSQRVQVLYRLPEQVTIPIGLGCWCASHSSTLERLLSRRYDVACAPFVRVPRRRPASPNAGEQ